MNRLSPEALLLLRAAMLPPERGKQYWQVWQNQSDWLKNRIHQSSYDLLPYIADRLCNSETTNVPMPSQCGRLRGIIRQNWVQNELFLKQLHPLLVKAEQRGIPLLFPDEFALAFSCYGRHALRPVHLQGITVINGEYQKMLPILAETGWKISSRLPHAAARLRNRFRGWWIFRGPGQNALRLESGGRVYQIGASLVRMPSLDHQMPTVHVFPPTTQMRFLSRTICRYRQRQLPPRLVLDAHCLIQRFTGDMDWASLQTDSAVQKVLELLRTIEKEED